MFSKLLWILLTVVCIQGSMRNWDYTILSFKINSTNEDVFASDVHLDRINRNQYAVSGTFVVKQDIGDEYFVYLDIYRSRSGVGEFFKLPYSFPNQTFAHCARNSYRQVVQNSLKTCSNAPQFDKNFMGPLPAEKFWFKNCTIDADDFPSYAQDGYYKICTAVVGPSAAAYGELLIKVDVK